MRKFRKWQFVLFLIITLVLVFILSLKGLQGSKDKTVLSAKTFIPKLIKNSKTNFSLPKDHLYLLAIPSIDTILLKQNSNSDQSLDNEPIKSSTQDESASSTSSIPYDYIALLDKDMNVVLEASDTFVVNSELGEIDINTPLILGQHTNRNDKNSSKKSNEKQYTYGVYDLINNKWLIPRKYTYIHMIGDDYYCAYDKNDVPLLFKRDGSLAIKDAIIDSNTYYRLVGEHIIVLNNSSSNINIYTKDGILVTSLDAPYINIYKNYMIVSDPNSDAIVYDETGIPIFTKETLMKDCNLPISTEDIMTIYQFSENSLHIEVQIGDYYIISTLDGNVITYLDHSKETDNNLGLVSTGYFTYSNDLTRLSFFDMDGKKFVTMDNNDYSDFIDPNYFYYCKDQKMELYDHATKETLVLDVSKLRSPYLSGVHEDFTFILSHDDENAVLIFYKDKLIYEGKQSYIELINNYIVVTNVTTNNNLSKEEDKTFTTYSSFMDSLHTIYNCKGEKIYESKENEKILSINDSYIQIMRDNSMGISSYAGDYLCKINLNGK